MRCVLGRREGIYDGGLEDDLIVRLKFAHKDLSVRIIHMCFCSAI